MTLKLDELAPLVPRRFSSLDGMVSSSGLSGSSGPHSSNLKSQPHQHRRRQSNKIFDDPIITQGYESVPLITIDTLDRGGISLETKSVGRVQVRYFLCASSEDDFLRRRDRERPREKDCPTFLATLFH